MEMENVVTISTHNGSQVALEHNRRKPSVVAKEPHIDPNGHYEIWKDFDPRAAYDEIFGAALKEYNEKQKNPMRKIKDYYSQICKDEKKHAVYEMIIGIYGKKEDGTPVCSKSDGKRILRAFVEDWERRNPSLVLCGAYYHDDEEGQSHVHLDYIPRAVGYSRGMSVQNSISKALQQQGFIAQGQNTEQMQWQARENQFLGSLCSRMGFVVHHPGSKEHLDTETYKAQKQLQELKEQELTMAQKLEQEKKELELVQDELHTLRDRKSLSETVLAVMEQPEHQIEVEYIPAKKKTLTKPAEPPKVIMLESDYNELKSRAQCSSWLKRALDDLRNLGATLTEKLNRQKRVAELQEKLSRAEQAVRAAELDLSYARADVAEVQEQNAQQQEFMETIKTRTGRSVWELFLDFITKQRERDMIEYERNE